MPLRLVRELEAHPDRLPWLNALGRPGQQLGTDLLSCDNRRLCAAARATFAQQI
jgi:hypothetical protein